MTEHLYIAPDTPSFRFTVIVGTEEKPVRETVQFKEKTFRTNDEAIAAAIDKLLEVNAAIRRRVRKADRDAAEKLVAQHRAMMAGTGAVKGGVTAEAAKTAMQHSLAARDNELRQQFIDAKAFSEENLQLTEEVPLPVKNTAPAASENKVSIKLGG